MSLPIHQWNEDDRPREKLSLKGRHSLSDAELIAILIGHGTRTHSAVDLGKLILQEVGQNLNNLARVSIHDLCKIPGIGKAKAISIIAAMELGARKRELQSENVKITTSRVAWEILRGQLEDLNTEEFRVLYLNNANSVIANERISMGGITGTIVDVRIIMKKALQHHACGMVLAHNHPSGNLKPSEQDCRLTKNLKQAASFLDMQVLDHIIIGQNGFYSFSDNGMMSEC